LNDVRFYGSVGVTGMVRYWLGMLGYVQNHEKEQKMKDKFIEWFGRNRRKIGYTVGVLNVLGGASYLIQGSIATGIVWVIIGGMIIFDTKEFK
jgi:hypothetical protein